MQLQGSAKKVIQEKIIYKDCLWQAIDKVSLIMLITSVLRAHDMNYLLIFDGGTKIILFAHSFIQSIADELIEEQHSTHWLVRSFVSRSILILSRANLSLLSDSSLL